MFQDNINRLQTHSVKWDRYVARGLPEVLPFWVADMDFPVSDCITERIIKRGQHPVYGYTDPSEGLKPAISKWYKQEHQIDLQPEHVLLSTGVLDSYVRIVEEFTLKGDKILVQTPGYPPLFKLAADLDRQVIKHQLILNNNHYEIDIPDLKKTIAEERPKIFVLCSPHNPIGKVWSKEDLAMISDCCQRYNVLLVVDEIHSDWVFSETQFISALHFSEELHHNLIVLSSPVKSFNIAGLKCSFVITYHSVIKEKLEKAFKIHGVSALNLFGLEVMEEVYSNPRAKEWLNEAKTYVYGNYLHLIKRFERECPKINVCSSQGTFLSWLDFSKLRLDVATAEINERLLREEKIELHSGNDFGGEQGAFLRMNIACSRQLLDEGLNRIIHFCQEHET